MLLSKLKKGGKALRWMGLLRSHNSQPLEPANADPTNSVQSPASDSPNGVALVARPEELVAETFMSQLPANTRIIVICGPRRTGTTLMNQILCADPGANAQVGEARIVTRLLEAFAWADENFDHIVKWYFVDNEAYQRFAAETMDRLLHEAWRALGCKDKLVLKAPAFSAIVDQAMELLPNSQFVVCVRHPLDQIASDLEVGLRQIERGIKTDNRAAKRNVAGFARTYVNRYEKLLAAAEREPNRFVFVRYEDVVSSPRTTVASLEKDLDLDLSGYDPEQEWVDFLNKKELSQNACAR